MSAVNPFEGQTTVVAVPFERTADAQHLLDKGLALHEGEPTDRLVVLVPEGTWREARDRIWNALGTAPHQSPREFEREQMLAHDNNMSRMMEGRG